MSIFRIGKDQLEHFTIVANPYQTFISSSAGATGSIYVHPRRSDAQKDVGPRSAFADTTAGDSSADQLLQHITAGPRVNNVFSAVSGSLFRQMSSYMDAVDAQAIPARKSRQLKILRFEPSFAYTKDTSAKLLIKNKLMPFYRTVRPSYQWGYTNYHALNFFTGSKVPSDSVLLYPNVFDIANYASASYNVTGAFTFEMYLNPRYTTDRAESFASFKAGTILHYSSTYALSLVTGSARDGQGYPNGFRLLLQLSQSANTIPSLAVPAAGNMIFMSNDNSLARNNWHHVVVRWGTSNTNSGTGSFVVDGVNAGTFVVPSASIALPQAFTGKYPDVLCVGNYYEGTNAGTSAQSRFFGADVASRDGLKALDVAGFDFPASYRFDHPLNAEVHDLSIRNTYVNDGQMDFFAARGIGSLDNVLFYVPPFFTRESPTRTLIGTYGGVPTTPFFQRDDTTVDPFNVDFSFGVGGHYLNLENFTKDFATGRFPRLLNLTATILTGTTEAKSANNFLYDQASIVKRNLTVLPCDDGNFVPNFSLLGGFTAGNVSQRDAVGSSDPSFISLENMMSGVLTYDALTSVDSGSLFDGMLGPSPEAGKVNKRPPGTSSRSRGLTIYQRTRDASSNEVAMFDISNLFYGGRIMPGSFSLLDSDITGSDGKVKITLHDDGMGGLYRADARTSHATWANIGNVLYEDGFAVLKTPEIPFFGKSGYKVDFRGEQEVHVMKVNVLALPATLNSSSNATYVPLSASFSANDDDQRFVYITNVNLHDENLNIVMKAQLAQPIIKRSRSKFVFRLRHDF